MKNKTKITIVLLVVISLVLVAAAILIPNFIHYKPTDIENKKLVPEKLIYNCDGLPEDWVEPAYAVRDNILSYSLVGEMPINEYSYTDLGKVYETELTEENFDKLFKNEGGWADKNNAEYLRKNAIKVLRADVLEWVKLTKLPYGERFYLCLFVKNDVYICHYNNNEMQYVYSTKIEEFDNKKINLP